MSVDCESSPEALFIGPFRVGARLGVGGMAAVWAAEHVESHVPVAIKVVHPDDARAALWSESLRHEVRALARLDHPSIVPLLDHGEIGDEVAQRSGGRLFAHTPYFVMLRTHGGTLEDAEGVYDHGSLVALLVTLLGALAHAHARGVVHRDVKPSNVLLDPVEGSAPRALLSDFGIAHALRRGARGGAGPMHAGTPAYMAPEQIAGRERDEGPATDLYALGCLVHRLLRGAPPFVGGVQHICRAHMLDTPPPLVAPWPMPRAFLEWVATLLAKRPSQRFGTAAHARDALLAIAPDRDVLAPTPRASGASPPSRTATTDRATRARPTGPSPASIELPELVAPRRPSLWPTARTLHDWRALPVAPPRPKLLGAGLGLYGLRTIPLAGRDAERDRLWSRLRRVHELGTTELVLLRGQAGHGKTRLAEWLLESTHELGLAVALMATHGAAAGPADGLGPMLLAHLRAQDLERDALSARVQEWLRERGGLGSDQADAEDLAAILERRHERFASPRDRHDALARLLRRIARRDALLLVLDDVVFGLDTIAFLESLRGSSLPMLVVATAREEDLVERADVARRLSRLVEDGRMEEVSLGALDGGVHARLVRELLGLEASLANEVAERTSGSPLFAVQLVGDWVQRGIVVPGPRGFVLQEGATARIPDDIHEVWRARVTQALAGARGADALTVLELASVLGSRVEVNEWRAACAVEAVSSPDEILALAADGGLFRVTEARVDFVHAMLRESLERIAREAGRLVEHHRVCALVVEERGGDPERAAVHHLAAGDPLSAIPLLFEATRRHLDVGDIHAAHQAFDRIGQACAMARLADDDPRVLRAALGRAEAFAVQGRLPEASRATDVIAIDDLPPEDAAQLAWVRAIVRQKRGDTAEALESFVEGRALARQLGDVAAIARCLYGAAECEKLLGRLDDARRHYESAGELFRAAGRRVAEARVLTGLSDLEGRVGAITRALALASESRTILEQLGVRHSVAIVTNGMGDLLRKSARLEEAEASYRDAIQMLEELGSADVAIVCINLGLVMLARGDVIAADDHLASVESDLERAGRSAYARMVRMLRMSGAAAHRDLSRVDAYLDEGERSLSAMIDPDVAWALERAAHELCEVDRARADRAARLSRAQWSALGDHVALARLDAILCGTEAP